MLPYGRGRRPGPADGRSAGRATVLRSAFDVGSDDVLAIDEMVDRAADHLGRPHPVKIHLPRRVIARVAPVVERAAKMPSGAIGGFVGEGSDADLIGDPSAVRALAGTPARPFQQAMEQALAEG